MSMNECRLHGFVGKDAELKETGAGKKYCVFSLATTENWKDPQGEKQSKTEWHNVIAWGKPGENAAKMIKKGTELIVCGKIEYQPDKENPKVKFTSIKMVSFDFCGKRGDTGGNNYPEPEPSGRDAGDYESDNGTGEATGTEDEIPF